jgi:transcriptional regulator with XRE-family HTH domain
MKRKASRELLLKIARQIKHIRETEGISQDDIYFETGIHIGRIETGKSNITFGTLEAICEYLEISVKDFFSGMED